MFRHYRVILRELVINTLPSYTSILNIAVGNTIYNYGKMNLIFVVPSIMLYSSEISPTRCNNCVFILRNGFTLHVFGRQSHPSSGVHMLYMATGKPAHLGCKFLSDV